MLGELDEEEIDLVVFGGDLTWGPHPEETVALVAPLADTAVFIRGNADRALLEPTAKLEAGEAAGPSATASRRCPPT